MYGSSSFITTWEKLLYFGQDFTASHYRFLKIHVSLLWCRMSSSSFFFPSWIAQKQNCGCLQNVPGDLEITHLAMKAYTAISQTKDHREDKIHDQAVYPVALIAQRYSIRNSVDSNHSLTDFWILKLRLIKDGTFNPLYHVVRLWVQRKFLVSSFLHI